MSPPADVAELAIKIVDYLKGHKYYSSMTKEQVAIEAVRIVLNEASADAVRLLKEKHFFPNHVLVDSEEYVSPDEYNTALGAYEVLLDAIVQARRQDAEFMARLRANVAEHKPLLDKLAGIDE